MAKTETAPADVDYRKYLDSSEPTPLMEHIEQWIRDKAEVDPTKFKTKAEAFAYGVWLTVHLRMTHQSSPENQARLNANRKAREDADAAKAERRTARAESGEAPRGRKPKAKAAEEAPAPKRRARKAAPAAEKPAAATEAPKRRPGRPRKDAAVTETAAADNVTPIRRRRAKPAATVTAETSPAAGAATEPAAKPVRRRAARRGEAAF